MNYVQIKVDLRRNNQVTIPKEITDVLKIPKNTTLLLAILGWFENSNLKTVSRESAQKLASCDRCVVTSDEQGKEE